MESVYEPWGVWRGFPDNVIFRTDVCEINISGNGGGDEKTRSEEWAHDAMCVRAASKIPPVLALFQKSWGNAFVIFYGSSVS